MASPTRLTNRLPCTCSPLDLRKHKSPLDLQKHEILTKKRDQQRTVFKIDLSLNHLQQHHRQTHRHRSNTRPHQPRQACCPTSPRPTALPCCTRSRSCRSRTSRNRHIRKRLRSQNVPIRKRRGQTRTASCGRANPRLGQIFEFRLWVVAYRHCAGGGRG